MKKTFGPKVERDRKLWYWCEHHKYLGYYNGLYVTHPTKKHAKWQDNQDKMKGRGKYENKSGNTASSNSSKEVKLVLSDSVKQDLVTNHGFTPLQIKQLQKSGNYRARNKDATTITIVVVLIGPTHSCLCTY